MKKTLSIAVLILIYLIPSKCLALQTMYRDQMFATASHYRFLKWKVSAVNSKYALYDTKGAEITGMAYSYGDKCKINEFISEVNKGLMPRNWKGSGISLSKSTGIDCSGFVSWVWGLAAYRGTSGLDDSDIATAVTTKTDNSNSYIKWDMKKGDIFNNPGSHVVLYYAGPFPSGTYKGTYDVYQATGSGKNDDLNSHKVVFSRKWTGKNTAGNFPYSPYRRLNIDENKSDNVKPIVKLANLKSGVTIWGESYPVKVQVSDNIAVYKHLGVPERPKLVKWLQWEKNSRGKLVQTVKATDTGWGSARNDLKSGNKRYYSWNLPVRSLPQGTHQIGATATDWKGLNGWKTMKIRKKSCSRVGVSDQWQTMKKIVQSGWPAEPGRQSVILVSKKTYHDAVVATPLSKFLDAPMLFTEKSSLSQASEDEIIRLATKSTNISIRIIGGHDAISEQVETDIKNLDSQLRNTTLAINRIAGSNAADTAAKISGVMFDYLSFPLKYSFFVFIVPRQYSAANGIASSSSAAIWQSPILYTDQSSLPFETEAELYAHYYNFGYPIGLIVIGDHKAVSQTVEGLLKKKFPGNLVFRFAERKSSDPTGLSTSMANSSFDWNNSKTRPKSSYVAFGRVSFGGEVRMEVLAGAALAAKKKAPLILAPSPRAQLTFFHNKTGEVKSGPNVGITLLGGTASTNCYYHYSQGDYPALNVISATAKIYQSSSTTSVNLGLVDEQQRYVLTDPYTEGFEDPNGNGWNEIFFKGQTGWIQDEDVQTIDGERVIELTSAEQAVYDGPSTDFEVIGKAHQPEKYVVAGEEAGWAGVFYDGSVGYLPSGSYTIAQPGSEDKEPPEIATYQPNFINRGLTCYTVSFSEPVDEDCLTVEAKDSQGRVISATLSTSALEPEPEDTSGYVPQATEEDTSAYEGDAKVDILEETTTSYDEEVTQAASLVDDDTSPEDENVDEHRIDYFLTLNVDDQAAEGPAQVKVSAKDLAGNYAEKTDTITIDASPPVSTLTLDRTPYVANQDKFSSMETTYTLDAYDRYSGVDATYLNIDNNGFFKMERPISFKFQTEGRHWITYFSVDNVGNVETPRTYEIIVDGTPPLTSNVIDPSKGQNVIPKSLSTLSSLDRGLIPSGVNRIEYQFDGGSWLTYSSPFTFENLTLGPHTLKFMAVDNVGNREIANSKPVVVYPPLIVSLVDRTNDPRVLVWLNYSPEANALIDGSKIEEVLKLSGAFYFNYATSPASFETLLRSNLFTSYLTLGDQSPLTGHLEDELREQVNNGKTVFSSLYHKADETPVRQNVTKIDSGNCGDELFGAKVTGKIPGATHNITLSYIDGSKTIERTFVVTGTALSVEPLIEQNPSLSGTLDGTNNPSMIRKTFGRGRTTLLTFDARDMLNNVGLRDLLTVLLKSNYPTDLSSSTFDTEAKLVKILSPGIPLSARIAQRSTLGTLVPTMPIDLNLVDGVEQEMKMLIDKPAGSDQNLVLDFYYLLRGQLTYDQTKINGVAGRLSLCSLIDQTLGQLDLLGGVDSVKVGQIKSELSSLKTKNLSDKEIVKTEIHNLLKAIDNLNKMQTDTLNVRLNIDKMILIMERIVWK